PARSRPQGIHLPPRLPRPRPHPHRRRGPVGARGHRHRAARPLRRRGAGMSLIVDVVAVILLAGNVYLGWRLGLFGRMFAVAGFEIALVAIVWLAVGNTSDRQFTNLPADRTQARQGIDNSLITSHVSRLDPAVQSVLKPVLPGDLSSSLADTTTNGKDSQAK